MYLGLLALVCLVAAGLRAGPTLADSQQALSLDPGFGSDGIARLGISGQRPKLVVQPDGRLVVAGTVNSDFLLARFTADGQPDTTFGTTGVVTADIGTADLTSSLLLQPDGKLLVVGGTDEHLVVLRYLSNGSPDPAFVNAGVLTGTQLNVAYSAALLDQGRFLVGGAVGMAGARNGVAACFTENGSLDASCGDQGYFRTARFSSTHFVAAILPESDGKIILVTNWGSLVTAKVGSFAIARYQSDGQVDMTFANGGLVFRPSNSPVTGSFGTVYGLSPAAEHFLFLTGDVIGSLDARGAPYRPWGNEGYLVVTPSFFTTMARRVNGEVVLGGSSGPAGASDAMLTVTDPTGHLSRSLTFDLGGSDDQITGLALTSDDAVVMTGLSGGEWFLARATGEPLQYLRLPCVLRTNP